MLETLKSDLKGAFSAMRHRPGVAAAVVMTLSLGIAANSAVFTVSTPFSSSRSRIRNPIGS